MANNTAKVWECEAYLVGHIVQDEIEPVFRQLLEIDKLRVGVSKGLEHLVA